MNSKLFIAWECGCVSFAQPMATGLYLVIDACDAGKQGLGRRPHCSARHFHGKTSKPLTDDAEMVYVGELMTALANGQRWGELKRLLWEP